MCSRQRSCGLGGAGARLRRGVGCGGALYNVHGDLLLVAKVLGR